MAVDVMHVSTTPFKDFSISNDTSLYVDSLINLFIQELDIILDTKPSTVLGDTGFGIYLEKYLWELKVDASSIESDIRNAVFKHSMYSNHFNWNINAYLIKGEVRDIILCKFEIKHKVSGELIGDKYYTIQ